MAVYAVSITLAEQTSTIFEKLNQGLVGLILRALRLNFSI